MTSGVFVCFGGGLKVFVLQMGTGTWRVGEKRMEPGFPQWCPGTRPEATGMLSNTEDSLWTSEPPFLLWLWLSTDTAFPEKLESLLPWTYSKVVRSWSWATLGCLNRGVGQNDLQRSHPTSTVLQFCDLSPTLSLFSKRWCYPKT